MIHRPLKEHYEMETDAGTTWRIFDYANDLEKYADYLEQQVKNLNIPAVIKSVCQCCGHRPIDYFHTTCSECGREHRR